MRDLTRRPQPSHRALRASLVALLAAGALGLQADASPAPSIDAASPAGRDPVVVSAEVEADLSAPGDLVPVHLWADAAADVAAYEVLVTIDPRAGRIEAALAAEDAVPAGNREDLSLGDLTGRAVLAAYSPTGRGAGVDRVALGTLYVRVAAAGRVEVRVASVLATDGRGTPLSARVGGDVSIEVADGSGRADGRRWPAPPAPWALTAQTAARRWVEPPVELQLAWETSRLADRPCRGSRAVRDLGGCIDIGDVQRWASSPTDLARSAPLDAVVPSGGLRATTSVAPAATGPLTLVVKVRGDGSDANVGDGSCRTASGACTLRAAIEEANANPGPDSIRFAIPGTAPYRISLRGRLPALSDRSGGTTIDGFSQPGATPNTAPRVSNADIRIQIVGAGVDRFDALAITSPANVIRGLSIHSARRPIWISRTGKGAEGNIIRGCVIGTDPAGTVVAPVLVDLGHGIHIERDSPNTVIGGSDPAQRNVISGNARHGVGIWHSWSDGTVIQGNIVGLSPDGQRAVPNRKHGLDVNFGASNTLIGGGGDGEGNLVSGNDDTGVEISHTPATADNRVVGNLIGTTASGVATTAWSGNANHGIWIEDGVHGTFVAQNVIGGNGKGGIRIIDGPNGVSSGNVVQGNWISIAPDGSPIPNGQAGIIVEGSDNVIGPGNRIVYQAGPGIVSTSPNAQRNTFTRNIVHRLGDGRLAIDLAPRGKVNPNDPGDDDTGPNGLLNFPVIATATTTRVTGSACGGCTVEVFWTGATGSGGAGNGPAARHLGSVVADSDGSFSVAVTDVGVGDWVSATATSPAGATSEMSSNVRTE